MRKSCRMIHCGWNYVIDCFMPISHKLKSSDMAVKSTFNIFKYLILQNTRFYATWVTWPSGHFVNMSIWVFFLNFINKVPTVRAHKNGPFGFISPTHLQTVSMILYHTISLFTVEMARKQKMIKEISIDDQSSPSSTPK